MVWTLRKELVPATKLGHISYAAGQVTMWNSFAENAEMRFKDIRTTATMGVSDV